MGAPKMALTVEELGIDCGRADRAQVLVLMKHGGKTYAANAVFDGYTRDPYTRKLDWREIDTPERTATND